MRGVGRRAHGESGAGGRHRCCPRPGRQYCGAHEFRSPMMEKCMKWCGSLTGVSVCAVLTTFSPQALAQQTYPARPIRLIVPYPPGGPTDIMGRITSDVLARRLTQNVVVENRGGA